MSSITSDYSKISTWIKLKQNQKIERLAGRGTDYDDEAGRIAQAIFTKLTVDRYAQFCVNCEALGFRGRKLSSAFVHCDLSYERLIKAVLDADHELISKVDSAAVKLARSQYFTVGAERVRDELFAKFKDDAERNPEFKKIKKIMSDLRLYGIRLYFAYMHFDQDYDKLIAAILASDQGMIDAVEKMHPESIHRDSNDQKSV